MKSLKEYFKVLAFTPNFYVTLVIGTLIGGQCGALVGLFQGGAFGHDFIVTSQCSPVIFGYELHFDNLHIILGAIIGLLLGAITVGGSTAAVLSYAVYNNTKLSMRLTDETIQPLIKYSLLVSIVLNAGMVIGAILGGFADLPFGSIIGALVGFMLMTCFILFLVKHGDNPQNQNT